MASPEAAPLAGRRTGRVALVVPYLSRWFFGAMVESLESVLRDAELDVLLYPVGDLEDRRRFLERLPAGARWTPWWWSASRSRSRIRRTRLRIPEDISVVGIDDHPLAALTDLTTVRQPVAEQGRAAGELLLAYLGDDATDLPHEVVLPTQLVVRGSTGPPR